MNSASTEAIDWLMKWYESQCDGDWEHGHGIRIQTIDNPGWALDVALSETPHAGRIVPSRLSERTSTDWGAVEVKDDVFRAREGQATLSSWSVCQLTSWRASLAPGMDVAGGWSRDRE